MAVNGIESTSAAETERFDLATLEESTIDQSGLAS